MDTDPTPDHAATRANDPGGAHAKGYSADPTQRDADLPDPIPLEKDAPAGIIQPERDGGVRPTGRSEPEVPLGERVLER